MNIENIKKEQNDQTISKVLTTINNFSHQLYLVKHFEDFNQTNVLKHLKNKVKDLKTNIKKIKINKINSEYKNCRNCKVSFIPTKKTQVYCNIICSQEYTKKQAKLKRVKKLGRV